MVLAKKTVSAVNVIRVGSEVAQIRPAMKYLGVLIDTKTNFSEKITRTAGNAKKGMIDQFRWFEVQHKKALDGICLVSTFVRSGNVGRFPNRNTTK